MKKHIAFLLLVFIFACKKETIQQKSKNLKPQRSIVQKHLVNFSLESISKKEISTWKEYSAFNDFLNRFSSISANEALNNALELAELTKLLKDSIRPRDLGTPAFKTRINVLENEVLRLKDMTYISAISANEVNNQVAKILEAFAATNSKINTVYSQMALEKKIHSKNSIINLNVSKKKSIKRQKKMEEKTPKRKKKQQ